MNEQAKKVARHPVTIGSGTVGGILGVYLILWQTGVFSGLPGTSTQDTAVETLHTVKALETRVRANEVEITHKADGERLARAEVILSNLVALQGERDAREDALVGEIRSLVETLREDQ